MIDFQCCFCGNTVNSDSAHRLDPCAIVVISHWQEPTSEQQEQQFFCHFECFKRVAAHAPMYLEDLDDEDDEDPLQ